MAAFAQTGLSVPGQAGALPHWPAGALPDWPQNGLRSKDVKALAWKPKQGAVEILDIPRPRIEDEGQVLVRLIEGGLCGTDREIVRARRGRLPEGSEFMILGHETLGEVVEAGKDAIALRPGDRVAIAPRRPCQRCAQCWRGRPDLCETGQYRERGIIGMHGMFAEYVVDSAEFVFALPPELYEIGVLMEPASVLAKTLTRIALARRSLFGAESSQRVLVLGAGPIGILAALFARLEAAEVHTVSLEGDDSLPATVLRSAGVIYAQPESLEARGFDCLIDCTGHPTAAFEHLDRLTHNAVVALLGRGPARYAPRNRCRLVSDQHRGQEPGFFGDRQCGRSRLAPRGARSGGGSGTPSRSAGLAAYPPFWVETGAASVFRAPNR